MPDNQQKTLLRIIVNILHGLPLSARTQTGHTGSLTARSQTALAGCALTIGNFDGVHRGHQAMLALLKNEASHRGLPSCVMTFEPHPRDYFAKVSQKPELAPARIATLRDKLTELARCGIDQCVVLPFNAKFAAQSPQSFIEDVLVAGLGVKYVLVGDDFRFGVKRAGDYTMLDAAGVRSEEHTF